MINERMKWPTDKAKYDRNYDAIFNVCSVCQGKGYHDDYNKEQDKWIRTTCLVCNGTGKRR